MPARDEVEVVYRWSCETLTVRSVIDFDTVDGRYLYPFQARGIHVLGVQSHAEPGFPPLIDNLVRCQVGSSLLVGKYDLGLSLRSLHRLPPIMIEPHLRAMARTARLLVLAERPMQLESSATLGGSAAEWQRLLGICGYSYEALLTCSLRDRLRFERVEIDSALNQVQVFRSREIP